MSEAFHLVSSLVSGYTFPKLVLIEVLLLLLVVLVVLVVIVVLVVVVVVYCISNGTQFFVLKMLHKGFFTLNICMRIDIAKP